MSTVETDQNTEELTLTFVTDFDAPVERVWLVWEDPRQLERWWGPPTWPATFPQHELSVGGETRYYMTGPEGQKAHGWWKILKVDAPSRIEFNDGFSDDDGIPDLSGPIGEMTVTLEPHDTGTRMTIVSRNASIEDFEKLVAMGMVEGMSQAIGQIPALLTES